MEAQTILEIRPALNKFLQHFHDCFGRSTARRHLSTYVEGQLGSLPRKSIEPMADAAGVPPRDLQQFLSLYRWDESAMLDRCQQQVAAKHAHPQSVGILDETSFPKKGQMTACVQRQHCGASGKKDNCVVSVHLGYATPEFHTLLDGELYLPEETWHEDRHRCRAAGIPDDVVYRAKWQIGLGQIERARRNGIFLRWLTFDEGYGGKPPFPRALDVLGQQYVGEVPCDFRVWTRRPEVLYREHANRSEGVGRPRKFPRLKVKNNPPAEVRHIARHSPLFRLEDWQTYHVKNGHKGPMVWKAKRLLVWLRDENGLPTRPHHLIVTYNVLEPETLKYFLSNAPEDTSVQTLLLVAFSRWKIERMFEDGKGELGLDHFEVRKFVSIQRHLILSCVSYLFLAEFHQKHRGEKSGPDALPGYNGSELPGEFVDAWWPMFTSIGSDDFADVASHPASQRCRETLSSQTNHPAITRLGTEIEKLNPVQVESVVAL
ncbi:MAG: IS701 family transposase [Phycisphaerales bacterium]|nr:IS701 family transposase [Phycisphaerales bacterium]